MDDRRLPLAVAFVGVGVFLLVMRVYMTRSERGRFVARQTLSNPALILPFRYSVALAPLMALGSILLGTAVLIPRSMGQWLSIVALLAIGIAFMLSYRVPPPFTPSWMRDEIRRGQLNPPRPDFMDWVVFWLVLAIFVIGLIALVVLIVVYHAGQP